MTLSRQDKKKKKLTCSSIAEKETDSVKESLSRMLNGIPKHTVAVVLCLSRLAYQGFFDCHIKNEQDFKDPRIIFTESDLDQCQIEVTSDFDGFGLLKTTQTHQLPTDVNVYSFHHLSIQEFLCAVYISIQSQQECINLLNKHFHEYPNVFTFVFGLTGLVSNELFQFIHSKLTSTEDCFRGDVITAMRCINESAQNKNPHLVSSFTLDITYNSLLPYDCVCISNILSCYPVAQLTMDECGIGNKEAKLLVKHYSNENPTEGILEDVNLKYNELNSEAMVHIMKIVMTSKPHQLIHTQIAVS